MLTEFGEIIFATTAITISYFEHRFSLSTTQILRKELCCPGAMTRRWAPQTRYKLRRSTASIMKDFILFDKRHDVLVNLILRLFFSLN